MNCLVIGDPHFKINNVEDTNLMTKNIISLASQLSPDFIVCLGDVLDRHESIHVSPLLRSVEFITKLSEIAPIYILIGNHDRPNNNIYMTNEHPFSALKGWKNIFIVDTTITKNISGLNFLFVPYVPVGRFTEAINSVDLNQINYIFAHQEFKGAKMGAIKSEIGDEWDLSNPLVISGHIHEFDHLQENIIYTGTPIQHSYSDSNDKTVFMFKFSNNHYSYERFNLGLPKKKILRLSCSESHKINSLDKDTHYKIILSGTPEEIKLIKLSDFKLPNVKFAFKTISSTNIISEKSKYQSMGFINIFLEKIKNEPELYQTFQDLFVNSI
jgi:DNA repair exonuclease SbcCD nuclease subunit